MLSSMEMVIRLEPVIFPFALVLWEWCSSCSMGDGDEVFICSSSRSLVGVVTVSEVRLVFAALVAGILLLQITPGLSELFLMSFPLLLFMGSALYSRRELPG
jgi:hypothetical protein